MKNKKEIKRVAIYCRTSTAEQHMENQLKPLLAFANSQNYEVEIFQDQMSGSNLDRPEFKNMHLQIKQGKFDMVMCWRFDRISRSVIDFANFMDELKKIKVYLYSYTEGLNTFGPLGEAMALLAMSFAQIERTAINERVMAGIARAKEKGVKFGKPYIDKENDVLKLYNLDLNQRQIAKQLKVGKTKVFSTIQRLKEKGLIKPKK